MVSGICFGLKELPDQYQCCKFKLMSEPSTHGWAIREYQGCLWIYQWNNEGTIIEDVIEQLRLRMVRTNYIETIHTWTNGKTAFQMMVHVYMFLRYCCSIKYSCCRFV